MGLITHYRLEDLAASLGSDLQYFNDTGKLTPVTGKLGQAYQRLAYGDGADYLRSTNKIHLTGSFSMSCWAFVTDAGSSANGLVTNHSHGHNTGAGITVKRIAADDYRISCNTGSGTGRTYHSYYGTSNIKDKWSRLTVRYHAPTQNLTLWVGENKERELTYPMATQEDYLCLFAWSTTYLTTSTYRPGAIIDDVRIYDHAISTREIRDLSLGLITQFPFFGDFTDAMRPSVATPVGNVAFGKSLVGPYVVFSSVGKRVNIAPVASRKATLMFRWRRNDAVAAGSWRTVFGCESNIHHCIFRNGNEFGIFDGGFRSSGVLVPNDNLFHQFVIVLPDDGTALFYYDGEWVSTTTTTLSLNTHPIDRIGDWKGSYWAGDVCDPKIFSTTLSPDAIKEDFLSLGSIDNEGSIHTSNYSTYTSQNFLSGIDESFWEITGSSYGTHSTVTDNLEIVNTSGAGYIGLRSKKKFGVGVRIKITADSVVGRHTTLIGIGGDTDSISAHAASAPGVVWYDRSDINSLVLSYRWEDGRSGYKLYSSSPGIDSYEIHRESETSVAYYRGGVLVHRYTDALLAGDYWLYFGCDGHSANNSLVVEQVDIKHEKVDISNKGIEGPDLSEVGITRGLAAWYPLLGDTLDYAGTSHATNSAGVITAEGYQFGVGQYASTNTILLPSTGTDVTVSIGATITPLNFSAEGWIGSQYAGSSQRFIWNVAPDGKMRYFVGGTSIFGNTPLTIGTKHSVYFTRNGAGEIILYLDGVQDGVGTLTTLYQNTPFIIGNHSGNSGASFIVDNLRVHNTVLTPEEVAIQAKLALATQSRALMAPNCLYTQSQFKEVIC